MRLEYRAGRPGWEMTVATAGLGYVETVDPDGESYMYWRENDCYIITKAEADVLEYAARTLFEMLIEAGQYVIDNDLFHKLDIPDFAIPAIKELWKDAGDPDDPARPGWYTPMLYSRYDLRPVLDGNGTIVGAQMYEINADTPTGLVETSVTQWDWFLDLHKTPTTGQWNTLFESLVEGWVYEVRRIREETDRPVDVIHFAYSHKEQSGEDELNTCFMAEAARAASDKLIQEGDDGFDVVMLYMKDIVRTGPETEDGKWVGDHYFSYEGKHIDVCFKLFPWEWMMQDDFAEVACNNMLLMDGTMWIEPIWKMLWSNKGILAILWELFKGDPEKREFLIPTWFEGEQPAWLKTYARKALRSREGAGVQLVVDGDIVESGPDSHYDGDDGLDGPCVIQEYAPPPVVPNLIRAETNRMIFGLWMVQKDPVALLVRESPTDITNNLSYAAGHIIEGLSPDDFEN
jgi:glutathionylspermidine synthase